MFKKFCHPEYYSDIRGDLEEIYRQTKAKYPTVLADIIYVKEIIMLFRISLLSPLSKNAGRISLALFGNFMRVSLRHLLRYKTHSGISIFGLTVGLVCCVLIALYVIDEMSYDDFHEQADRIYRVSVHSKIGGNERDWALCPSTVPGALKEELPEVEGFTRIAVTNRSQRIVTYEDQIFDESDGGPAGKLYHVDSNFFKVFTFEFVEGSMGNALNRPNTLVISAQVAQKIFKGDRAVGRTIEVSSLGDYEITGVLKAVPSNSHLKFDYLLANDFRDQTVNGGFRLVAGYIRLSGPADGELLEPRINEIANKRETSFLRNGIDFTYFIQPVRDIHLTSGIEYELSPTTNILYIYIFSSIAVFILLIASVNYVNLSTAQISKRAKEVGVRKVMGAGKQDLIGQFFVQSFMTVVLSFGVAILVVLVVISPFSDYFDKDLSLLTLLTPERMFAGLLVVITVALFSAFYPALVMSRMSPMLAIKEDIKPNSSSQVLRKLLTIFQFSISVVLISATVITMQQLYFLTDRDLGFEDEKIFMVSVDRNASFEKLSLLKNRIEGVGGVVNATLTSGGPIRSVSPVIMIPEGYNEQSSQRFDGYTADFDFISTYGLDLIAGRDFDPKRPSDSLNFIVNRTAIENLGWNLSEAIGKGIDYLPAADSPGGKIIGVVEDFHYRSLHNPIGPVLLSVYSRTNTGLGLNYLSIRIDGSLFKSVTESVKDTWYELFPGRPHKFAFVKQSFEQKYSDDKRTAQLTSIFAILAILIASLGLFGLALFIAEQRRKEIGIRKILGASVPHIIARLSKDFFVLVLIGNLIAFPVTYIFLSRWLEDFAYHIDINAVVFLLAGLSTITIAFATVGYQTGKAALSNPINALKDE